MKANKVYLSRLKRGFKDKAVMPFGCSCTFAIAKDPDVFFIKLNDCKVHGSQMESYNYCKRRFDGLKDYIEVRIISDKNNSEVINL